MRIQPWIKGLLVLSVVFLLGVGMGISISRVWGAKPTANAFGSFNRPNNDYFESLKTELSLDETQSKSINTILNEMREEYKAVCAEVRPRYDQLRERTRKRIKAVLTTPQQEKFESIVTKEECNCPYLKK